MGRKTHGLFLPRAGRSNVVAGLARAIRLQFTRHALVKVGTRGRAAGTPVETIIEQLEVRDSRLVDGCMFLHGARVPCCLEDSALRFQWEGRVVGAFVEAGSLSG